MKPFIFVCLITFGFAAAARASVRRVVVTKDTQEKSEIAFTLIAEPVAMQENLPEALNRALESQKGDLLVQLSIPMNQKPLEHLWRTELWVREGEGGKRLLSIPIDLRRNDKEARSIGDFLIGQAWMANAEIAIRCGQRAPLQETIYQIVLKSYVDKPAATGTISSGSGATRPVPVIVRGEVSPAVVISGESIPLKITISNGLGVSIYYLSYSLQDSEWNGETASVNLADIYRDDSPNLYLSRPALHAPLEIAGMTSHEIRTSQSLAIRTDARKWKLTDGWLPGRYKIILSIGSLRVDPYTTVTISSDPIEFEIK